MPALTPYVLVIDDVDALEEKFVVVLDTIDDVAKVLGEYFAATGALTDDGDPIPVPEFHDVNGYAMALWLCDVADHVECPVEWTVYGPEEIRSPAGQPVVTPLLTGHDLTDWCKRAGPMMALAREADRDHRHTVTDVITSL